MTEPLQPDAMQRLRDALLNANKTAQQEPAPMFGWYHPDDYERYSKLIADLFMSPTHCNCEQQH